MNKAILILKSIGLLDEIRQSWKDIFLASSLQVGYPIPI